MAFEIYFLIRFISKMNGNSSGGKCPLSDFIPQMLKDIG